MKPFSPLDIPQYTVSGLNLALKDALKAGFGRVRVRGEISDLKRSSGGNVFFSLKDEGGFINAMCVKGMLPFLGNKIVEQLDVLVTGEVVLYNSNCLLKVVAIARKGYGSMLQNIEDTKIKLAKEGLFDGDRKLPLGSSLEIERIGVITSAAGAVLHDIINRVRERFAKQILVYDTQVQGDTAHLGVIDGLVTFEAAEGEMRPDVIIIARGGGSFEDLMPFNNELLARAIAKCGIPVVSAIGHETDYTITDLAASVRAPTPTAAAEIVTTPTASDVLAGIGLLENRMKAAFDAKFYNWQEALLTSGRFLRGFVSFDGFLLTLSHSLALLQGYAGQHTARFTENLTLLGSKLASAINTVEVEVAKRVVAFGKDMAVGNFRCLELLAGKLGVATKGFDGAALSLRAMVMENSFKIGAFEKSAKVCGNNMMTQCGASLEGLGVRLEASCDDALGKLIGLAGEVCLLPALEDAFLGSIAATEAQLALLSARLTQASPKNALDRGFAIIRGKAGHVKSVADAQSAGQYQVQLKDGTVVLTK